MNIQDEIILKENVSRFHDDVRKTGSYTYTAEKLSSRLANKRISESVANSYDFLGKRILDLGSGDGTYTLEFPSLGTSEVIGIDPAEAAVEVANQKAIKLGLSKIVKFHVGNVYSLKELVGEKKFDCVVLRGVLHHLPDPAKAIDAISKLADIIIIIEPNGYNPILKFLERFSKYHIDHEEKSFFPNTIKSWLRNSGFKNQYLKLFNLVPMFCPDWMARVLNPIAKFVEYLPIIREVSCGQVIIVANRWDSSGGRINYAKPIR